MDLSVPEIPLYSLLESTLWCTAIAVFSSVFFFSLLQVAFLKADFHCSLFLAFHAL